ncbi:MAG: hypothetical protein EON48_11665, partial [Acetobacteraceae bacterium]
MAVAHEYGGLLSGKRFPTRRRTVPCEPFLLWDLSETNTAAACRRGNTRKTDKMNIHTVTSQVGSNPITFETGKIAKLADGAVVVTCGETVVLVTAVSQTKVKAGQT